MNIDSNPLKILYYKGELYKLSIGEIPNPIMLEIDPCDSCNFHCPWCSSSIHLKKSKHNSIDPTRFNILESFARFANVGGIYWCGGGEPTLNPYLGGYMLRMYGFNIKNYITTNGSTLINENIGKQLIDFCSWIGISINSGTEKMWRRYAPQGLSYDNFLKGLKKLNDYRIQKNKNIEVNYKFVYDPISYVDIHHACKLAIDLGFTKITLKPADLSFSDDLNLRWDEDKIDEVNNLISMVKNSKNIEVDCGKFYPDIGVSLSSCRNYNICWTSCLAPVFGADGYIHICCVRRGEKPYFKWDDGTLNEWWGSDEHRKILFGFNPKNECPLKCKMGRYNEIFQEIFINGNFSKGSI